MRPHNPASTAPRFYLGGASPRALGLSGRQADVHLSWIEPLEDTAKRNKQVLAQFSEAGRTPELGLRTHLVVRDTEEEAWAAANELILHADPAVKAQRQSAIVGTQMVGQQAQAREVPDHRVGPHLWNGLSEVRVNCGTAIVGTPQQAADTLFDYARLGFREVHTLRIPPCGGMPESVRGCPPQIAGEELADV